MPVSIPDEFDVPYSSLEFLTPLQEIAITIFIENARVLNDTVSIYGHVCPQCEGAGVAVPTTAFSDSL